MTKLPQKDVSYFIQATEYHREKFKAANRRKIILNYSSKWLEIFC